jgi:hypothetical protein
LFFLDSVALSTKSSDLLEHSMQQRFGRGSRYPGFLKLPDLAALAIHLNAHPLDLGPNTLDVRHGGAPSGK